MFRITKYVEPYEYIKLIIQGVQETKTLKGKIEDLGPGYHIYGFSFIKNEDYWECEYKNLDNAKSDVLNLCYISEPWEYLENSICPHNCGFRFKTNHWITRGIKKNIKPLKQILVNLKSNQIAYITIEKRKWTRSKDYDMVIQ